MSQTQALQIVAVGDVTREEYAYQQARRQLREAKELCRQAVNAVNAVQSSVVAAYLHERYPGHTFTVTPVRSKDPDVFMMNVEIACDPGMEAEEVIADVDRYLTQLAV